MSCRGESPCACSKTSTLKDASLGRHLSSHAQGCHGVAEPSGDQGSRAGRWRAHPCRRAQALRHEAATRGAGHAHLPGVERPLLRDAAGTGRRPLHVCRRPHRSRSPVPLRARPLSAGRGRRRRSRQQASAVRRPSSRGFRRAVAQYGLGARRGKGIRSRGFGGAGQAHRRIFRALGTAPRARRQQFEPGLDRVGWRRRRGCGAGALDPLRAGTIGGSRGTAPRQRPHRALHRLDRGTPRLSRAHAQALCGDPRNRWHRGAHRAPGGAGGGALPALQERISRDLRRDSLGHDCGGPGLARRIGDGCGQTRLHPGARHPADRHPPRCLRRRRHRRRGRSSTPEGRRVRGSPGTAPCPQPAAPSAGDLSRRIPAPTRVLEPHLHRAETRRRRPQRTYRRWPLGLDVEGPHRPALHSRLQRVAVHGRGRRQCRPGFDELAERRLRGRGSPACVCRARFRDALRGMRLEGGQRVALSLAGPPGRLRPSGRRRGTGGPG